jgi:hypothetical protein
MIFKSAFVSLVVLHALVAAQQQPKCRSNWCANGGTCQVTAGRVACTCPSEFIGPRCELPASPCVDRANRTTCANNATCTALSPNTFSLLGGLRLGEFSCACSSDYTGRRCELLVNPCISNSPCQNDATCNLVSPGSFNATSNKFTRANVSCSCAGNTMGKFCEAFTSPCDYVGTGGLGRLVCQNNSTCTATSNNTLVPGRPGNDHDRLRLILGNFTCACTEQFAGPLCQFYTNPCDSSPCVNNGTCVAVSAGNAASPGRYTCTCTNACAGRIDMNCACRSRW